MKKHGMRKRLKRIMLPAYGIVTLMMMNSSYVAAASIGDVTDPINKLKTLMLAVVGALGVITLIKNIMEFAQSWQHQDTATMHSALKGIAAGAMMTSISVILSYLGF